MRAHRVWTQTGIGVVVLALLASAEPKEIPTPEQAKIGQAMRIAEAAAHREAVREAVAAGLLAAPSREARERVFSYLSERSRWIDLTELADILEQYSKVDRYPDRPRDALDMAELRKKPRDERAAIYTRAIQEGQVVLRRSGVKLLRQTALMSAAWDGIEELRPLIEAYMEEALPSARAVLLATLELRAGGRDRDDAAIRGAKRLAAMPDQELWTRMDDAGFREAALAVVRYVCEANPFTGAVEPQCTTLQAVAERQGRLFKQKVAESGGGACALSPLNAPRGATVAPAWLAHFTSAANPGVYMPELL